MRTRLVHSGKKVSEASISLSIRVGAKEVSEARAARSVKSAERVLDLIEHIGQQQNGVTFSALSRNLSIPKSSLHALLNVLTSREYVQFHPEQKGYSLGIALWEAGEAYQRGHGIVREARAVLEFVVARVNETAQLAKLVGSDNVYLSKVDSTHPLRLQSEVGGRLSAHATGVGKALLAQLDGADVRRRFGQGKLRIYTANTIPTVKALLEELEVIRTRGFAIDNEEYTPGIFCIAVPVFEPGGAATTALSVSVPVIRARGEFLGTLLSVIVEASLQLSTRCGVTALPAQLVELTRPDNAASAIDELVRSGRYRLAWAE